MQAWGNGYVNTKCSNPLVRVIVLVGLNIVLFSLDLHAWNETRINYHFIFDMAARDAETSFVTALRGRVLGFKGFNVGFKVKGV